MKRQLALVLLAMLWTATFFGTTPSQAVVYWDDPARNSGFDFGRIPEGKTRSEIFVLGRTDYGRILPIDNWKNYPDAVSGYIQYVDQVFFGGPAFGSVIFPFKMQSLNCARYTSNASASCFRISITSRLSDDLDKYMLLLYERHWHEYVVLSDGNQIRISAFDQRIPLSEITYTPVASELSPIPIPATLPMLLAAICGIAFLQRKRKPSTW